jgi:hypothetical protein
MWDDSKRLTYLGLYAQYGCGSVYEIDQHLVGLADTFSSLRPPSLVLDAIVFDRDRLLELRALLVDLERLRDDGPVYVHDVIGGAA